MSDEGMADRRLDEWAAGIIDLTGEEARALVAEVRRLRAAVDKDATRHAQA